MTLELAQTLHGYTQGHRLLAQGGDIVEAELHELDRLSDLSGYLPSDASFDAYHTAFPCGRYHAFACTWPDRTAPRRGTVLTHTLLIPRELWLVHDDLGVWAQLHRKPSSALEREPFTTVPQLEPLPIASAELPREQLRGLLQLWLGQPERPLLWVGEPSLALARVLWPWLWPEARRSFSFCTFALQVRVMRDLRPFELLVVPPAALGSFLEQSESRAWWREGRVWRGEVEPWIDALLDAGPDAVAQLIGELRARELAPMHPGLFRTAQRFVELHGGAAERLAAARAHLDLLARVWPGLAADHPAVVDAVRRLIARQADAPLAPRPLWDLQHMLGQGYVRAQLDADTTLAPELLACVREQLDRRLHDAAERAGAGLVELYASAHPRAREVILAAIRAASPSEHGEPLAWAQALLDHAEQRGDAALEQVLWDALPLASLVEWLHARLATLDADARMQLRERASTRASERGSPELARAAWGDDVAMGLRAAAVVVASHPDRAVRFEALVQREPEADQLAWCLDCEVESLRGSATRIAVALLRKDKLTPNELASRCEGHRLGARIFNEACPWALERDIEAVLREHEQLAQQLVSFLLEGSTSTSTMVGPAGRAVPGTLLWTPASRLALARGKPAKSILDVLVPRLLSDILAGSISADEAGAWLSEPYVGGWLRQAGTWELDRPLTGNIPPGALTQLVLATRHALRSSSAREPCIPLARMLEKADRDSLAASLASLVDLLEAISPSGPGGLYLRAEVLGAIDRHRIPQGWRLVELAFYPVYLGIVGGMQIERVSWWRSYSWDRAKHWRHWLLDTWVSYSWPPESLVRCLGGDVQLAERVFKRASKQSGQSKALLRSLGPAVAKDARLRRVWGEIAG